MTTAHDPSGKPYPTPSGGDPLLDIIEPGGKPVGYVDYPPEAVARLLELGRVRFCRDVSCRDCEWPETYTEVEVDSDGEPVRPVAIGCSKCGSRSSRWPAVASDPLGRQVGPGFSPPPGGSSTVPTTGLSGGKRYSIALTDYELRLVLLSLGEAQGLAVTDERRRALAALADRLGKPRSSSRPA